MINSVALLNPVKSCAVLIISLLFLAGCNVDYETMVKNRIDYAKINQHEIVIAAIRDPNSSHYIKGVQLAVEEINNSGNALLDRPVKLIIEQNSKDFESAKSVIRRIISNPKISVVMGHRNEKVAIPASFIYEKAQVLFFSPFITSEELTSHNLNYTFRMLPDNEYMATQISKVARVLKYKDIAILYDEAEYYYEFYLLLAKKLKEQGLNPLFNRSFLGSDVDFRPLLSDLKKESFDAIFISAKTNTVTQLVKQLKEMGIDVPIFGSNHLISESFETEVGVAVRNKIIAPSVYSVLSNSEYNSKFKAHYRSKYNEQADVNAALGYDSVMLFASKVKKANSTMPASLASTVHYSSPWKGVTGAHKFNKKGNILSKKYFFRVLNNGKWHKLSEVPKEF